MPKFSRYALTIQGADAVHLVSLRLRTIVSVSAEMLGSLTHRLHAGESGGDEAVERLLAAAIEAGIVVDDDLDELGDVVGRSLVARADASTFALVISPTLSCNMRCHYCFEQHDERSRMDDQTAARLVAHVTEQLKTLRSGRLHVRWFGGEPLTMLETVRDLSSRLIEACSTLAVEYSADVVTNGFHLDGSTARLLRDLGVVSAQVTFDGDRRIHDRVRRTLDGEGSFDRLVTNASAASEFVAVRARVHVAPYNRADILPLLDRLAAAGLAKRLEKIYFAPLFNYQQGAKESAFASDSRLYLSSAEFADEQVELVRAALDLGFKVDHPLDVDYGVCTALREATVVVNPDGSLAKCYLDAGDAAETFSHVTPGHEVSENRRKWRRSVFTSDAECRECTFAPVCLGGCTKQTLSGANKALVCTPLRFNAHRLLPLFLEAVETVRRPLPCAT